MLDVLGWLLTINENANLREELRKIRSAKPPARLLSLAKKVAALEAENEELKIRLGLLIRMLAQSRLIDVQKFVADFKELHSTLKE